MKISVLFSLLAFIFSSSTLATEVTDTGIPKPKERRYALSIGGIASTFSSSYDSGSGGPLGHIDLEGTLDLPRNLVIPSVALLAHIKGRHQIFASYFATRRSSTFFEGSIGDADLGIGAKADLEFDTDNLSLEYGYTLHEEDGLKIMALGGLYVLDLSTGVTIEGGYSIGGTPYTDKLEESVEFIAPFPMGGVNIDYRLNRNWFFSTSVEAVYLPVGDIRASAIKSNIHARYAFRPSLGIVMGISHFNIAVDIIEEDRTQYIQYGYDGFFVGAYYAF